MKKGGGGGGGGAHRGGGQGGAAMLRAHAHSFFFHFCARIYIFFRTYNALRCRGSGGMLQGKFLKFRPYESASEAVEPP